MAEDKKEAFHIKRSERVPNRKAIEHLEHLFSERQFDRKTKNEYARMFNRLVSEFITTVSHELRTPVTIAKNYVSLLLDGIAGKVTPEQRDYLKKTNDSLDRLVRLIEKLIISQELETGAMEVQKEVVNVVGVVSEVFRSTQERAKEKKMIFTANLPDAPVYVFADRDKIKQVVFNLVDNAFRFSDIKKKVTIEVKPKKDQVLIAIVDKGMGIPKENLNIVFDKFQQIGRTYGPGEKGLGLGLSIAKEVVEMHGGHITLDSKVKQGSRFEFSLPVLPLSFNLINEIIKEKVSDPKKIAQLKKYGAMATLMFVLENGSLDIDFKEAVLEKFQTLHLLEGSVPVIFDHLKDFLGMRIVTKEKGELKAVNIRQAFMMAYIEKNMGSFKYKGKPIYDFGDIETKRMAAMALVKSWGPKQLDKELKKLAAK